VPEKTEKRLTLLQWSEYIFPQRREMTEKGYYRFRETDFVGLTP